MSLLTPQKLETLVALANEAPAGGIFVEVGVYRGGSLLELAKVAGDRLVFGFDTFTGLPQEYDGDDEVHEANEFDDTSYESVCELFKDNPNVFLIQGLFPDSAANSILDESISFAHLDMDFWRGTLEALAVLWPRVVSGGMILFDDYDWENCPGISPLVETWAEACDAGLEIHGNQALIIKK